MPKLLTVFALFSLFASPVMANEVALKYVPDAQQVGMGRLSVAFWDVYDATLYAQHGKWSANKPYALSIQYFREIEGADIAKRSVEEMQKQGFSDATKMDKWQAQMRAIFPDVKNGSELTAVLTPQKTTHFYFGSRQIGSIRDAEFGLHFFNIWLGEKTSEPELRRKLLGLP